MAVSLDEALVLILRNQTCLLKFIIFGNGIKNVVIKEADSRLKETNNMIEELEKPDVG